MARRPRKRTITGVGGVALMLSIGIAGGLAIERVLPGAVAP